MIRRPPRSTQSRSSAASDVYKRQDCSVIAQKHKPVKTKFIFSCHPSLNKSDNQATENNGQNCKKPASKKNKTRRKHFSLHKSDENQKHKARRNSHYNLKNFFPKLSHHIVAV